MARTPRYRRFFSPMFRLPESLLAYLTDVDYHDHFAWAALVREDGREVLVGVSRYVRLPERPGAALSDPASSRPRRGRSVPAGTVSLDRPPRLRMTTQSGTPGKIRQIAAR